MTEPKPTKSDAMIAYEQEKRSEAIAMWSFVALLMLGLGFAFHHETKAINSEPSYAVQSVTFLENETPDVINSHPPAVRIETDKGALLLARNEIGYKLDEKPKHGYTVIETYGYYQQNDGAFVSAHPYTLYIPKAELDALQKAYQTTFGEPLPLINDGIEDSPATAKK